MMESILFQFVFYILTILVSILLGVSAWSLTHQFNRLYAKVEQIGNASADTNTRLQILEEKVKQIFESYTKRRK